jgi:hypothetical protein
MEVQKNAHSLHPRGCSQFAASSASPQKPSPWLVLPSQGLTAEVRTFLELKPLLPTGTGMGPLTLAPPKSLGGPSERAFALRWEF